MHPAIRKRLALHSRMHLERSPKLTRPIWKRVDQLSDLVQIFEPEVQICTWKRKFDPQITAFLKQYSSTDLFQLIETTNPNSPVQVSRLGEGPGRSALIADLARLKEIVHDLLGCPETGLRLAHLAHAMCPGWHFDRMGIRLLCTCQGLGTEWLDDQTLDRASLPLGNESGLEYQQASEGEIVLLKGSLWQGNELFGSIHRSPEMAQGQRRFVVTVDPLW